MNIVFEKATDVDKIQEARKRPVVSAQVFWNDGEKFQLLGTEEVVIQGDAEGNVIICGVTSVGKRLFLGTLYKDVSCSRTGISYPVEGTLNQLVKQMLTEPACCNTTEGFWAELINRINGRTIVARRKMGKKDDAPFPKKPYYIHWGKGWAVKAVLEFDFE